MKITNERSLWKCALANWITHHPWVVHWLHSHLIFKRFKQKVERKIDKKLRKKNRKEIIVSYSNFIWKYSLRRFKLTASFISRGVRSVFIARTFGKSLTSIKRKNKKEKHIFSICQQFETKFEKMPFERPSTRFLQ